MVERSRRLKQQGLKRSVPLRNKDTVRKKYPAMDIRRVPSLTREVWGLFFDNKEHSRHATRTLAENTYNRLVGRPTGARRKKTKQFAVSKYHIRKKNEVYEVIKLSNGSVVASYLTRSECEHALDELLGKQIRAAKSSRRDDIAKLLEQVRDIDLEIARLDRMQALENHKLENIWKEIEMLEFRERSETALIDPRSSAAVKANHRELKKLIKYGK